MAEKKENVTFTTLSRDIKARRFSNIYVLQGDEPYYIDKLAEMIIEQALDESERDFNFDVHYGDTARVTDIINSCKQYPTFAERRVVVLREAQLVAKQPGHKDDLNIFKHYADKVAPSTVLVICHKEGECKAKEFLDVLRKCGTGVVFTSSRVRSDRDLRAVITSYASSAGVTIDVKSVQMLGDFIGADLSRLFTEIDKLVLLTGGTKSITPELIERNVGISKDFNNFELEDALRTRNAAKAYRIIDYFEHNPKNNPVIVTVSMLFSFFSGVLLVRASKDKSPQTLMQAVGTKSQWRLEKFIEASRNYSTRACVNIISYLRECDAHCKGIGSRQNEYALLRELVFKILNSA